MWHTFDGIQRQYHITVKHEEYYTLNCIKSGFDSYANESTTKVELGLSVNQGNMDGSCSSLDS